MPSASSWWPASPASPAEVPLPVRRTLLFYATSPVHLKALAHLRTALVGWELLVIAPLSLADIAPGIAEAAEHRGFPVHRLRSPRELDALDLAPGRGVVAFGAVFDALALTVLAWALERGLPTVAIEEVAQLALNDCWINNYDAPFTRLFVASREEGDLFRRLGYPDDMLSVSGLLAREAAGPLPPGAEPRAMGAREGTRPRGVLYTTSPLLSRRTIENLDTPAIREGILRQIRIGARALGLPVVVKLHPNEDPEPEGRRVRRLVPGARVIGRDHTFEELAATAALVINRGNSQTALDAALTGVPTLVVALGACTVFHRNGGAWIADRLDEIPARMAEAVQGPGPPLDGLRRTYAWAPPGGVAAHIAGELRAIVGAPDPAGPERLAWLLRSMLFVGISPGVRAFAGRHRKASRWHAFVAQAIDDHFAGDHLSSERTWRAIADIDPAWFFPWQEIAYKALGRGDHDQAREAARQAIVRHPPFHRGWHVPQMRLVVADAERLSGRPAEAERQLDLQMAEEIGAVLPEIGLARCRLYLDQGRWMPAARELTRVARILQVAPLWPDVDGPIARQALAEARALRFRRAPGLRLLVRTMAWIRTARVRGTLAAIAGSRPAMADPGAAQRPIDASSTRTDPVPPPGGPDGLAGPGDRGDPSQETGE